MLVVCRRGEILRELGVKMFGGGESRVDVRVGFEAS